MACLELCVHISSSIESYFVVVFFLTSFCEPLMSPYRQHTGFKSTATTASGSLICSTLWVIVNPDTWNFLITKAQFTHSNSYLALLEFIVPHIYTHTRYELL